MKLTTLLAFSAFLAGCGTGDPAPLAPTLPEPARTAAQTQSGAADTVQLLYIATLGRPADPAGLAYWSAALAAADGAGGAGSLAERYRADPAVRRVVDGIAGSPEALLLQPPDDRAMVAAIHANLLNRPMDGATLAAWTARIASGELSRMQALLEILERLPEADQRTVLAKLAVARAFSAHIDTDRHRPLYRGIIANGAVRRALGGIGADSDSAAAALQLVAVLETALSSSVGKPQTIWFAPADTAVRTWAGNRNGSDDYMQLFEPGAAWAQAASRVKIFKMYSNVFLLPHLPGSLTDDQIRTVLADLRRRNIALAVEHGPLYEDPTPPHCGTGVEGFGGSASLRLAERIRDLGGDLAYLAMDEPFQHARDVCGWSAQAIARNAAASIAEVRKVFPDVQVGDIEVVPGSALMPDWVAQYGQWMDAWKAETGRPLAFFHADINWGIHYTGAIAHARRLAHERGIPFGIIYNGWHTDRSDAEWVASGMRHYAAVELGSEVPEQVVFQSWDHYPERVLPETSPASFTYLINSYFRTRTAISLATGGGTAHGTLEQVDGTPLPNRTVTLSAQPAAGRGVRATYTLSGSVPAGTERALIQVCINQCGETGTNDMSVYGFGYFDTGGRVGSYGFAEGWARWGKDPAGTASASIGTDSHGAGLHTAATQWQRTFINSMPFPVTPGAAFTLSVTARVSPGSAGSGVFALIFLKDAEHSRSTLPFGAASIPLGSARTGTDGSYRISYPVPPGRYTVRASHAGDAHHWPAMAQAMIGP